MNDHHTTEGFQLSPQQMRLWRFQEDAYEASTRLIPRDQPRGSVYRAHCSFLLNGSLNVNRLQVAIDKAVSRHEVYRTYLCRLPGMKFPLQVVAARAVFTWQQANLRDDAPEKPTLCLAEIVEEQKQCPIDLEHGPLLHFSLVSLSDHEHILFLHLSAFHADNRSLAYLMSTIAECYGKDLEEHNLSDIDDVAQYIQFSEWQHALLAEAESRIGREYWGKLDLSVLSHWGLQPPGSPHPSSSTEVFLPASFAVPAPKDFHSQLSLLLKHYDISAAHFFLACWHILLWRLTGQERSIIAVGTDGRIFEEQAEIAGLLTTYLPMSCILSDHQRFSQILGQVKQVADEASEWQYYWIGEGGTVQGHEDVDGSITRSLCFPFCFDFSHWSTPSVVDGISFSLRECHTYVEPFQIKVSAIHKADDTFMLEFHYNTRLFSIKDIQRIADQYSTLLQSALSQPEARLYELEVLSEKARVELLVAFNAKSLDEANVQVAYPGEECFHHLFEELVELIPEAIAVVFDDVGTGLAPVRGFTSHLTYQELNTRANQLAHLLRRRGVGLDVPVGICLGPSLEMVVGILGILKAGGAYVPLDPSTPAQRLAFLLEETQPALVLIQDHLIADRHSALCLWSSQWGNPTDSVFCMDTQWHRLAQESCTNPSSPVEPANLAYIIYTSGSTGRPKGVMITHQGLSNYLVWSRQHYQVERGYGSVVHSSLSFDLTITSLFLPLASGRTVLLVPEEERIEGLVSVIRRYPYASLLKITPAHLSLLNQMLQASELPDVTHALVIGGEALAASTVALWRELAPQTRVINEYGPTETVVGCSIHEVTTNGPDTAMVPIGSPIANMQLYILDARGKPVPIGVTGELFIGGAGMARGYKNRSDLTAERFLPHPFSSHPGERLYRSGDLACYRPDGTIAYLGRLDHQVKLRGYRIELGEIEATLRAYPFVQEAVVILREEDETRKYLVAYVVVQYGGQPHQQEDLQSHLRKQLPDYMVPARVVELESLPLLPNGKVDRSALAVVDVAEEPNQTSVSASTPLQELLRQIWQDVLQRQEIGIHENFFKLGGHSLLATQVIARVREIFQVDMPLRSLFEAPTIGQLAQLIEGLMRQGALLPALALVPMERPDDLPLSFAQERLWFLHQWDPESTWYNIPIALRLSGELDISALEQSLQALVQRHEALRTTFEERLGRTVQVVKPQLSIQVPVIDLTGSQGLASDGLVSQFQRLEAERPFDLSLGPLLRVSVLRLGEEEHVLLVTLHHIVTDGWSMEVLVREMTALYQAYTSRQVPALPALPIQYADYALWQREWLQDEVLEAQMAYWRMQLADLSALKLPTDHPRPRVKTDRGASQSLRLSRAFSDDLLGLCQKQDVTLFMLLLSAFQVLLMRYTGQSDISVGTPIANRRLTELEELIGFFVNTLVMRTDLSGNPTFLELLHRVREVCLQSYAHQDIPFEKVVEEIAPERDLSRAPLFQVMLILQNASGGVVGTGASPVRDLAGVRITPLEVEGTTSKFDLTLSLKGGEQGLDCLLEYSTDLFEADTATGMLSHFQTLLEGIVQDPQAHLSDLPLFTEAEREQLLVQWNATQADFSPEMTLPQLFKQQVERSPDAVALVFKDKVLTYAELNRRANKLAHYLQRLGVGPEILVGIALVRSVEMVIALLAVLKAGGAYVPLDPAFPQERLAHMIQDAQITVLLTQSHLRECLRAGIVTIIAVDMEIEGQENNPANATQPDHLVSMIYTSGSTGRPKGVLATHRATLNRLEWMWESFPFEAQEVCCQKTSLSFVDSVWEIFGPLLRGIRLILITDEVLKDAQQFIATLTREQITRIVLVPSLLRVLLNTETDLEKQLPHLKYWTSSGEALPADLSALFLLRLSQKVLLNLYGSSEVAADATCYDIREGDNLLSSRGFLHVPIGRPIANTQIFILDAYGQPVPIGVTGELCIGGLGVARGYKDRPDLTAERFIPHPFSSHPGVRLYRSGDLACYQPDGTIAYLGRLDHQVKLRGYRIELGEIEATLRVYPFVQEAVVVLREEDETRKYLVAYVAKASTPLEGESRNQPHQQEDLQSHLRKQLPDYMVPARVIELESLPLLPNGKVDRSALAIMDVEEEPNQTSVGASTPQQELLVALWQDVLGQSQIGIHESFFKLGGHSLLATQVIARVRQTFQVDLPLRSLFEAPTIGQLAQLIEGLMRQGALRPALALVPMERPDDLPLSFAQERLWFLHQWDPGSTWYNIPIALRLSGSLDISALEQSLQALGQRHEVLRTTIEERSGYPVQAIKPCGARPQATVQMPVIDLSGWQGLAGECLVSQFVRLEAERPFDLSRGPLLRVSLLRLNVACGLAPQEHVLLLTLHHIVTDAWSMGVLVREMTTLYQAYTSRQAPALPALPIQYADYALWQRQWLQGEVLEAQMVYWRKQLADLSVLRLPTDHPRPRVKTDRGASQSLRLSRSLSDELLRLCQKQDVTLFMLLLSAFQVLLMRYTGQGDICVGTPIANRRLTELEGLIGFFVNTLVMRTNLSGNPTFLELLHRVREVCLQAYAHQDIPFEKVVEEIAPERDLSRSPLFQVMLVLQNAPGGVRGTPTPMRDLVGVRVTPLEVEGSTSKFDLTLSLKEREQGLDCLLEYSTDLFEADTATGLLSHFQALLEGLAQDPQARLADLSLLTQAERDDLLVKWNRTKISPPLPEGCVHQFFERQMEQTPDAVALVMGLEEMLAYGELDRRANHLAHHLHRLGVAPEVFVGICMQPSLEMVIAVLAVLKAGGAYVPLDPGLPRERLTSLFADAQPLLLLTRKAQQEQVLPPFGGKVFCFERDWQALEKMDLPHSGVAQATDPANIAYLIYTSGSSGRPKGVLVEQRQLFNYIWAMLHQLELKNDRTFALLQPLTVDSSVTVLFSSLCTGGCLSIISRERALDPQAMKDTFSSFPIDCLKIAPSHLATLHSISEPEQIMPQSHLIIGGEASRWNWAQSLCDLSKSCSVINHYGPTETTVGVLTYRVEGSTDLDEASALSTPLGHPLANTQAYVLDAQMQPCPIGVWGELCIAGAALARGYLHSPDLTAECFVPHPYSLEAGARLYRTGDLTRYRADGTIEYLGRIDRQVKIRGSRVELGEIEVRLAEHPAIQSAVVLAREDEQGSTYLVAYCVRRPEQALGLEESDVHAFLQERLPAPMIPQAFVELSALPLTPHGKLDLRALPQERRQLQASAFVGPRSSVERTLATIWSQVLRVEAVSIHENFFALGGHSLLATQVIARIRQTFQVDLPLRSLFEAPTVAQLSDQLEEFMRGFSSTLVPDLLPMERPADLPLSFAQERLWFLYQWDPGSTWYNVPIALRLAGELDISALEQSLQALGQRHEVLRTTFEERLGCPVQVIKSQLSIQIPVIDLSGRGDLPVDGLVSQFQRLEAQRPFDLSRGPLLRVSLLRLNVACGLAPQEHVLLLTLHHIVTDAWSMEVLVREMTILYQAHTSRQAPSLPRLPIQYADYALWQREWLQGEVLEAQMAYWREQLADLSALKLPTDHPRPRVKTDRGAGQSLRLSRALSNELLHLCQKQDVTLFMLLLSVFQVLLMRYTGQTDINVGTPVANRRLTEVEGLIGFFLNTLVMRTDLSGNPTFLELLHRVREVCLQAYMHQDIPFEKVVEELEPERDLSRSPLFQVMLLLQNTPLGRGMAPVRDLAGTTIVSLPGESMGSKFDLTLSMTETVQGLQCVLKYSTDLFEAESITRLLHHFQTLLQGIVQNPQTRLADLPLLTDAERHRLLVEWNATQTDLPLDMCVDQLIERQMEQTPDAVALAMGLEEMLTYGELNRRANQLAHYLRKRGVGPEALVGLCMERCIEMVVAVLAVLKAGGAYVPLDPSYPQARLASLLADAQPLLLLTLQQIQENVLPRFEGKVFCLDRDWELVQGEAAEHLDLCHSGACRRDPAHPAYLIYTSGSTGQPKGVLIEHRQLFNYTWAMMHQLELKNDRTFALLQPLTVDSSVTVIFSALSTGGCLQIISREQALDSLAMQDLFKRFPIDCLKIAPSHLAALHCISEPEQIMPESHLIIGGEASRWEWVECLSHLSRSCTVINHYGPTETTVGVLTYRIERDLEVSSLTTPLGYPLANTQAYVLDAQMQPCPIGVWGELYIAGAGLARGYLHSPDLTAERFVPHPYVSGASVEAGARLYRTGDLTRYRADGTIEYLGRMDRQVKIRGSRMELGEIEVRLGEHLGIQRAVVLAREDEQGNTYLVAYCVRRPGQAVGLEESDVRAFLQERLPVQMIPQVFVELSALPLTPHGKLDLRALPRPLERRQLQAPASVGPGSSVERTLARIWSQVLRVEVVSIHDNFFALGGHSLLATQVIARVRQAFQVDLPLRSLFEAPTIGQLAQRIEGLMRQGAFLPAPALVPMERPDDLPLSFAQERLWFLHQWDPGSTWYNVPIALRLSGKLNISALEESLQALGQRHEVLRTTFEERLGCPVQVIKPQLSIQIPVIDLTGSQGVDGDGLVSQFQRLEVGRPFDLSCGPLLRLSLLRLDEEVHVLLLTLHHIVTDAWSMGVLVREMTTLYQAHTSRQVPALPTLPIQYADYALWQREWLQDEVLDAQMAYWRRQLADLSALRLPTDHPRPRVKTDRGASQSRLLPKAVSDELLHLCQKQDVTLFMLLLATFQVLLLFYTGQSDICVGTPIANRTRPELGELIGFFLNTLVMRTDLSDNPTFLELLHRVREVCLQAYAHQDIPFEKVVAETEPERDLSRSPLFQVMLILQNTPLDRGMAPAGLTIVSLSGESTASKFDLTLSMTETVHGLQCVLKYSTDLFEADTITGMLKHFQTLLEGIVQDPQVHVEDVSLLTEGERDDLLVKWNRTKTSPPLLERRQLQASAFVSPRSSVERTLAMIWSQVLRVEPISIHENFFALGGHSLLATQVIARVRQTFQVDLPLRSLFEAPTVAQLSGHLEELIRGSLSTPVPALLPMERPTDLPLSFAQERLWFLHQWDPDSSWYNVPIALRLSGELDISALEESLQALGQRHEVLRTTFEERLGCPVQVIKPQLSIQIPVIDLTGCQGLAGRGLVSQLQHLEAQRPFDLSGGPLLRVSLLRLGEEEQVLLLTLHHIVTDAWSMEVLVREMTTLYQAHTSREVPALPPLPIQYADYALWQREWLQGEVLDAQMAYWREQLADLSALKLPTDHPRPRVKTDRGASQSLRLSRALSDDLLHLCHKQDVTLFMLLLSAFQVLLMRYTGQTDISIGAPVANRRLTEVEELIGFFVNTLVMRTNLSGNPTFLELLGRVREVCLQAYAHQDIPFEKVVAEIEPERDLSRSPLFQVMLVLQNTPVGREMAPVRDPAGMKIVRLPGGSTGSKFDLILSMTETVQGLACHLKYSTDLFEADTMTRMLHHFQTLLTGIVQDPQALLSDLPMLTVAEREHLLVDWNVTKTEEVIGTVQGSCPLPREVCAHRLFEQQVEQTPDSVTLVFEDEVLTYRELNRRANQLAHYLQRVACGWEPVESGLSCDQTLQAPQGPEILVGICMERSIEMVVGLLAVLKAGGAYVPLDPTSPLDRLAFMMQNSHVSLLLTQERLCRQIPASAAHLLVLEQVWETVISQSDQNPMSMVESSNLAYIIYTSGSTGVPKGVQVTHRGLGNLGKAQAETFAIGLGSRVLQFASLSFDASISEILMALLVGGSLHLERMERMLPGPDLMQVLQEQAITCVTLPPSALAVLPTSDPLPALQTLVVAGEACPVELMARWAVGRRFFNAYGPTEATVCASIAQCSVEQANQKALSLGRPLMNTQFYVLDRYLQPVPFGVLGEIYLGGVGLARGYLHQPEASAERFVPHPFVGMGFASLQPGERLYRTGDLARYLPDGTIEYLGRIDSQVKLRGYRIELGEIEARLLDHPAVQDCIVIVREDEPGEKRLVAYVIASSLSSVKPVSLPSILRNYLKEKLLKYMVPAAIVLLERLPLTTNGKVDRSALPIPELLSSERQETFVAPRTAVEEVLAGIWEDVLGGVAGGLASPVGIHDNFFELGGHSLLATQVVARVRQALSVELPLRSLFEAPTILLLSQHLEKLMRAEHLLSVIPLLPVERPVDLPLSFAQERLWFLHQWDPSSAWYNVPLALRLSGTLDISALEQSLQALGQRHEVLRTTFEERLGRPVQVIKPQLSIQILVIDLTGSQGFDGEGLVSQFQRLEAERPFDLSGGPLLRVSLLRLDEEVHVLLLTLHHIVIDGWSMGVLVREITTLYQAHINREAPSLPPLPIQYADYALWQRQWLQGDVLQQHLAYWKKQLWRVKPLALPTDVPPITQRDDRGASYAFTFPAALSEELMRFSRQEGVTLFMVLLTAFQVLLYRLTGKSDIVVGTDVAGRTHVETEGLIGFFVNLLALRTNVQRAMSFCKVVQQVRTTVLEAYMHQEVPFDLVVEHIQVERSTKQTPLVQVLFVLQNAPRSQEQLSGITLEPVQGAGTTARFDLALFLSERATGLSGRVVYRSALFKEQTIALLVHRLEVLVRNAVARPDTLIDQLEIETVEEQAKQANYKKEVSRAVATKNWRKHKAHVVNLSEFQIP